VVDGRAWLFHLEIRIMVDLIIVSLLESMWVMVRGMEYEVWVVLMIDQVEN